MSAKRQGKEVYEARKRVSSSSKKSAVEKLTPQEMRALMDRRRAAAAKRAAKRPSSNRSAAQREAEIQALLSQFGKSKVARAAKQVQRELTAKRAVSSSDVVVKGVHVTVVKKGARKPSSDCKKLKVTATKSVLVCPVFDGS